MVTLAPWQDSTGCSCNLPSPLSASSRNSVLTQLPVPWDLVFFFQFSTFWGVAKFAFVLKTRKSSSREKLENREKHQNRVRAKKSKMAFAIKTRKSENLRHRTKNSKIVGGARMVHTRADTNGAHSQASCPKANGHAQVKFLPGQSFSAQPR